MPDNTTTTPPNDLDIIHALRAYHADRAVSDAADRVAHESFNALTEALAARGLPRSANNILQSIITEIDSHNQLTDDQAAELLTIAANHYRTNWIK